MPASRRGSAADPERPAERDPSPRRHRRCSGRCSGPGRTRRSRSRPRVRATELELVAQATGVEEVGAVELELLGRPAVAAATVVGEEAVGIGIRLTTRSGNRWAAATGAIQRRQREATVDKRVLAAEEEVRAKDMRVLELGDTGRTTLVPGRRGIPGGWAPRPNLSLSPLLNEPTNELDEENWALSLTAVPSRTVRSVPPPAATMLMSF